MFSSHGNNSLQSAKLALVLIATSCLAQQLSREDQVALAKIDRVVEQQMLANKIPGVSLAVLRKGKVIHLKRYGLANVEHHVPVKPSTIFQSGSIGKQFTAAAVILLVQENKLALDEKISREPGLGVPIDKLHRRRFAVLFIFRTW